MPGKIPEIRDPNAKPSTKQVYLICRLLCEANPEVEFPETKREASILIGSLKEDSKEKVTA